MYALILISIFILPYSQSQFFLKYALTPISMTNPLPKLWYFTFMYILLLITLICLTLIMPYPFSSLNFISYLNLLLLSFFQLLLSFMNISHIPLSYALFTLTCLLPNLISQLFLNPLFLISYLCMTLFSLSCFNLTLFLFLFP